MSLRIVVLDGETLNPGDLAWDAIAAHGHLTVHAHTDADQVCARAADADVLLTNKTPLGADVLDQLPSVGLIGVLATGYDVVDIEAATARNMVVCNVPEYGTDAVAEHVFALLFALWRRVSLHDEAIREGEWARQGNFSFHLTPQLGLAGKTMGIVGFGRIGQAVATRAHAFGMQVITATRGAVAAHDVDVVGLDELFQRADVVSLHCPANAETNGMINRSRLARMKNTAVLINTARGSLINERHLAASLRAGVLGGALLDVAGQEPISPDNPLLDAPNCILTPHLAWSTLEARARLLQIMADNIGAWLDGRPQHQVNT